MLDWLWSAGKSLLGGLFGGSTLGGGGGGGIGSLLSGAASGATGALMDRAAWNKMGGRRTFREKTAIPLEVAMSKGATIQEALGAGGGGGGGGAPATLGNAGIMNQMQQQRLQLAQQARERALDRQNQLQIAKVQTAPAQAQADLAREVQVPRAAREAEIHKEGLWTKDWRKFEKMLTMGTENMIVSGLATKAEGQFGINFLDPKDWRDHPERAEKAFREMRRNLSKAYREGWAITDIAKEFGWERPRQQMQQSKQQSPEKWNEWKDKLQKTWKNALRFFGIGEDEKVEKRQTPNVYPAPDGKIDVQQTYPGYKPNMPTLGR